MARIRTVKPEFWSDAKIKTLSHSCMAFFIGMWNFCDDEGKIENSPSQMSLRMPVFRSKDIPSWLSALSALDLIRFSADSQWVLVTNWKRHQRISRKVPTKIKADEIQWLDAPSLIQPVLSTNTCAVQGKERKGKDRIGKDSLRVMSEDDHVDPNQIPLIPERASPGASPPALTPTQQVVAVFYEHWRERYNARAPLMPQDHKKLRELVDSFGADEAATLIRGYFSMPDSWFITKRHDVQSLMSNLPKVQHFVSTGEIITRRDAQAVESTTDLNNQLRRLGGGA